MSPKNCLQTPVFQQKSLLFLSPGDAVLVELGNVVVAETVDLGTVAVRLEDDVVGFGFTVDAALGDGSGGTELIEELGPGSDRFCPSTTKGARPKSRT